MVLVNPPTQPRILPATYTGPAGGHYHGSLWFPEEIPSLGTATRWILQIEEMAPHFRVPGKTTALSLVAVGDELDDVLIVHEGGALEPLFVDSMRLPPEEDRQPTLDPVPGDVFFVEEWYAADLKGIEGIAGYTGALLVIGRDAWPLDPGEEETPHRVQTVSYLLDRDQDPARPVTLDRGPRRQCYLGDFRRHVRGPGYRLGLMFKSAIHRDDWVGWQATVHQMRRVLRDAPSSYIGVYLDAVEKRIRGPMTLPEWSQYAAISKRFATQPSITADEIETLSRFKEAIFHWNTTPTLNAGTRVPMGRTP